MSQFRTGSVSVVVPATSANIGPGFDSLGLALALHDLVSARVVADSGVRVEVEGLGERTLPRDGRHLVARAMAEALAAMDQPMPGLTISCRNAIPQGRGLGSSAGAIVAGILLARGLVADGESRMSLDDVLDLATKMEGHPDNVAAALFGGFTTAWIESDARAPHARCVSRPVHEDIVAVAFVPPSTMSTANARRMLPDTVSRADAVFNLSRAAVLVHALTTDPSLLMSATEDRLHQEARAAGYPESHALVEDLRSRGVAAAISGAGPSVLALTLRDDIALAESRAPEGWTATVLAFDGEGARVHTTDEPA